MCRGSSATSEAEEKYDRKRAEEWHFNGSSVEVGRARRRNELNGILVVQEN